MRLFCGGHGYHAEKEIRDKLLVGDLCCEWGRIRLDGLLLPRISSGTPVGRKGVICIYAGFGSMLLNYAVLLV